MLEKTFCKTLEFWQWLCRKPSAGLIWAATSGVQYAAAAAASTVRQAMAAAAAMTQVHATLPPHATSAAAAVWASGSSFPVSAMLLIYTYSLLPARALSTSAVAEKPR